MSISSTPKKCDLKLVFIIFSSVCVTIDKVCILEIKLFFFIRIFFLFSFSLVVWIWTRFLLFDLLHFLKIKVYLRWKKIELLISNLLFLLFLFFFFFENIIKSWFCSIKAKWFARFQISHFSIFWVNIERFTCLKYFIIFRYKFTILRL